MTTGLKDGANVRGLLKIASGFTCRLVVLQLAAVAVLGLTGCQTTPQISEVATNESQYADAIILREGDMLKITFPGASNLDSTQQIRRDGKIALAVVGEIKAAGLSPAELEKAILKQASTELVSKEVTVTLESSSYPVFITGAVVRPGKIMADHQITALEAIMESGGFDYTKANLTKIRVIRHEDDHEKNFTINLKKVLDGTSTTPFYLKPSDIVFVPVKFSWF